MFVRLFGNRRNSEFFFSFRRIDDVHTDQEGDAIQITNAPARQETLNTTLDLTEQDPAASTSLDNNPRYLKPRKAEDTDRYVRTRRYIT